MIGNNRYKMSDLAGLITSEKLFNVEITSKPIAELFSMMNKKVKDHEGRIQQLEDLILKMVTKEDFESKTTELQTALSNNNNELQHLMEVAESISDDLSQAESRLTKLIDERVEDVLVTTTTAVNSATNNLDQTMELFEGRINNFLKRESGPNFNEDLLTLQKKIEELQNGRKNSNTEDDFDFNNLAELQRIFDEKMNERFKEYNKNLTGLLDDDDGDTSSMGQIARLKMALIGLRNEISDLKINNGLNDRVDELEQHSRTAFGAINEQLANIQNYVRDLKTLPPLMLDTVVPYFFPEGQTSILEAAPPPPAFDDAEKVTLLGGGNVIRSREVINEEEDGDGFARTNLSEEQLEIIIGRVSHAIGVDDIRDLFDRTMKQNEEILSALDRKVDREFDERLFDKFRAYITELAQKVGELQDHVVGLATRDEVEEAVGAIRSEQRRKPKDTAAAMKNTCLFCGRPRTAVTSSISPRTGRKLGVAPVAQQSGAELIYADGGAFIRDEFPRAEVLPPLPDRA